MWGPPNILSLSLGVKGPECDPDHLTPSCTSVYERMELYLHFAKPLDGMMLNYLSKGATLVLQVLVTC
jgi:hypothetical protein